MSATILFLALSAALLHASWNALAKSGANPVFNIAAYQLLSSLLCIPFLPFVSMPGPTVWVLIAASTAIHTLYYFSLAQAYRSGDLSAVYPLLRGLAPVLVAVSAWLFAGETLTAGNLLGVLIISVGIMSLTLGRSAQSGLSGRAIFWGCTTAVLIASYTVVDGSGVRAAVDPLSYIVWLFLVESIPVVMIVLATQRTAWFHYIGSHKAQILFGGVASTAAYGMVIYAMSLGAMAVVSSLRETSVIFATLIGAVFLGERFGVRRVIAAVMVTAGVIVMRLW